jgi:uncharacterized NAD-dependent epimerase/dehydratase family protein
MEEGLPVFEARGLAILAEGKLGVLSSKTAACIIRYRKERVVCVIDSTKAGCWVEDVLGFGGRIPVVASIDEAYPLSPDTLLIGIAPRGGALPGAWRGTVLSAVRHGLNIASGLHTMLGDDPEISEAARKGGVRLWDLRKPVIPDGIAEGKLRDKTGRVVLTVGSDSRSGKMTVAFELARALASRHVDARFVATGQTGILLAGRGVVIDRVPGDFMSRVVEDLTVQALSTSKVAVVEGQGSIIHPGYSGVALAIMHGCYPDAMVLCHQPSRTEIEGFGVAIPDLAELVEMHEELCKPLLTSKVIAVALNTFDMTEDRAAAEIEAVERRTGLPTTDPVRWGCDRICDAVEGLM